MSSDHPYYTLNQLFNAIDGVDSPGITTMEKTQNYIIVRIDERFKFFKAFYRRENYDMIVESVVEVEPRIKQIVTYLEVNKDETN